MKAQIETFTSANDSYILYRCCPKSYSEWAYSFDIAETVCQSAFGSSLASIHTANDYNEIYDSITAYFDSWSVSVTARVWIGLKVNNEGANGQYMWSDGTSYDYPLPFQLPTQNKNDCFYLQYSRDIIWSKRIMELYSESCTNSTEAFAQFVCNAHKSSDVPSLTAHPTMKPSLI
eukprot:306172_1